MVTVRGSGRLSVVLLARFLPIDFRERQCAEWLADLDSLAEAGPGVRARYLFWAAMTLPALRAAAHRAGLVYALPAPTSAPAPIAVTALSRILLLGLGWPVLSWLLAVPGRYGLSHIFGLSPTSEGPLHWLLFVPMVILIVGAYAGTLGGSLLAGSLTLATFLVGSTLRRARRRDRIAVILVAGAMMLVLVPTWPYWSIPVTDLLPHRPRMDMTQVNLSIGPLGSLAIALGLLARRLTRRMRALLILTGLGGVTIFIVQFTSFGTAMRIWFLD